MKPPINFCPRCGASMTQAERFGQMRPVCPACGYIHFYDPKVAAAVFIEDGERVLLVRRGVPPEQGKWALPAGFVDAGEDPRHTAVREALEETGLDVRITRLLDVFHSEREIGANIVIVYAAEIVNGMPHPLDDVTEVGWFAPDSLPEIAFESTRALIAAWIEARGK